MSQETYDKLIRQAHNLEDYKAELVGSSLALFLKMKKRIGRIIKAEYTDLDKAVIRKEVLKDVREEIDSFKAEFANYLKPELKEFQSVWYGKIKENVSDDLEVPDKTRFSDDFYSTVVPINKGKVVSIVAMVGAIRNIIRQTADNIIVRASVTDEPLEVVSGYFDSAMSVAQSNLDAIVRTAVAITAGMVVTNLYRNGGAEGHQQLSVLDSRTSDICSFRHAKVWYYNDPSRSTLPDGSAPPYHYSCRSILVPVTSDGPLDVPTYSEWFGRQPARVQREVLGINRYNLYKSGEITIEQFSPRGRRLTLEELKKA